MRTILRLQKETMTIIAILLLNRSKITFTNSHDRVFITVEQVRRQNTSFFFKFEKFNLIFDLLTRKSIATMWLWYTFRQPYMGSSLLRVFIPNTYSKNMASLQILAIMATDEQLYTHYWRLLKMKQQL